MQGISPDPGAGSGFSVWYPVGNAKPWKTKENPEVRFGITQVRLPGYAEHPLWMIVVQHGKREPMVLVTSCHAAELGGLGQLAWGFLAAFEEEAGHLVVRAQRLKQRTRPNVPFYTLIKGWPRLFAAARVVFHPWLRGKRPKDPPQLSLFPPNPAALLP